MTHPLTNAHRREVQQVARDVACDAGDTQGGEMTGSHLVLVVVQSAPTAGQPR